MIISFDPGTSTGVAVYENSEFDSCTLNLFDVFDRINNIQASDVVVCESFFFRPGSHKQARVYDSLYIIGALQYKCHLLGVQLVMQSPAEGKGFCDNTRLRRFGCWVRGQSAHERDALRHLVLYLCKQKIVDPV